MKSHLILLFLAILSTGIMAGIFFTWSNAVTPGIGLLKDMEYLNALQSMNRVILNPLFYIAFFAPIISAALSAILGYQLLSAPIFRLVIAAAIIYLGGVILVTVFGNIPLNIQLDQTDLSNISAEGAKSLRDSIEVKWNNFNWIRTFSSFASSVLLLIACFLR